MAIFSPAKHVFSSIHLWGVSFHLLFFQKQRQLCQRSNWPKCLDFGITCKADHHLDYIESGKILLNMIICNSENKRQASLTSMEIWIFEPPHKTRHNILSAKLCHPCCCDDDHQDYRQDYHGAQADMRFVKTNLEPQFATQKGAICLFEGKNVENALKKHWFFKLYWKS